LNALYALLFVLSSFAAPAQALDASMIDLDDYFGEITEPSTVPAQMVATEPTIEKLGEAVNDADDVATTGPNNAVVVPVGAIQLSDEAPSVEYSTRSDDKLTVEDTTEPSTMPAQIVASEPTIGKPGEALDEGDGVATTGPNNAAVVPVGAIQLSGEAPSVVYSTRSDDKLTVEDTTEPRTMPAQIVASEPTIGKPGEALDEGDGVAASAPTDAADIPVGAIEPSGNESEGLQGG
jgi:F420-dependent methylenetetrahydromethanopterin dehydrogenase